MFGADGQAQIFLIMLLCGIIIGLIYAVVYIVRFCFGFRLVSEIILDLLFSAAAFLLALLFLHRYASGEIRLYTLTGIILGFFLCYASYFKILAKLTGIVYNTLIKAYGRLKVLPFFRKLLK